MDDRELEILTRMSVESDDWDRPEALSPRTAACLSISRIEAFAGSESAATEVEQAHLRSCRLCANRYRAFGGSVDRGARSQPSRRWLNGAATVAACLLVWALLDPHPANPRKSPTNGMRVEVPAAVVCILGDSNCDGVADSSDLTAFTLALHHPDVYAEQYPHCDLVCSNDLNGDCEVNDSDMQEMVQCVGG